MSSVPSEDRVYLCRKVREDVFSEMVYDRESRALRRVRSKDASTNYEIREYYRGNRGYERLELMLVYPQASEVPLVIYDRRSPRGGEAACVYDRRCVVSCLGRVAITPPVLGTLNENLGAEYFEHWVQSAVPLSSDALKRWDAT